MQKVRKAVIPAAGLGTRFLPATKAMPKEMMPVVDTPSIQFVLEEALASGIEDILIITGKGKNAIEDHFDANITLEDNLKMKNKDDLLDVVKAINIPNIHYVRQPYPKGLGDAILQAETFVANEPFAVLLGDDIMPNKEPLTKTLIDVYNKHQKGVVAAMRIDEEKSDRYGIIDIKSELEQDVYEIEHVVEKPKPSESPSNLGIIGRYILSPDIFDVLRNQKPDSGEEIQLTDAIETLNEKDPMIAYQYNGTRYDVGDKYGMLVANIEVGLQHKETSQKMHEHIKQLSKELKN